jgi:hypothetical protein
MGSVLSKPVAGGDVAERQREEADRDGEHEEIEHGSDPRMELSQNMGPPSVVCGDAPGAGGLVPAPGRWSRRAYVFETESAAGI